VYINAFQAGCRCVAWRLSYRWCYCSSVSCSS